ncbi:sodium/solute symporter [Agriterribacter sp.]|uniref:sodium:solute symporter family transporter n=1 Tax=Agriterribacter sp. TaxID=2821509 RepID=UPI002BCFC61A|nr:sodium/solute symporter [Agriterribacter sp.]HRP54908.1 sodium/solute symporter [Agriterribacter sp.]
MKQLLIILFFLPMSSISQDQKYFNWNTLSPYPDKDGWAGSYAGVSNGALIIAGGANFPDDTRPWNNGKKAWHKKIFVLEMPDGSWKEAGSLPREMGYGVSLTYNNSLLCIGGGDARGNYADVFMLTYLSGAVETVRLPDMPAPLINACGVMVKDVVYIAGGIKTPDGKTEKICWSLDLAAPGEGWNILPEMPGSSRMLATAATADGKVYVLGGVELVTQPGDSVLKRNYLKDCWEYTPADQSWKRIADLPHPVAAAPGPAYNAGQSHIMLFGGDNGENAAKVSALKDDHPGFSSDILAYNTITDTWSVTGKIPINIREDAAVHPHNSTYAPVTTPLVIWNNNIVIAGGEVRPAVRTNKVLMATPRQPDGQFGWLDWSIIGLYFLLVIGISMHVSKNMGESTADFFLGGQKIPWWAAGLSIFGSKLSALTFIAIPAKAYATDWVFIMNNVMIIVVAPIVTMFYLPYFRKLKITSVYEYLEIRFSRNVKLLGSLTFVLFQLSRLGVVIYLPALVLSTVTGINIFTCIVVTTLVTTAYSVAGGIEAVVWTEVMQVFVLLGGALAALFFISYNTEGGFSSLLSEAYVHDKFRVANLGWSISQPVLWVVAVGAFLTNLVTYTSDQVVVQRYLTTSTESEARRSIYTNALMVIPASLIFFGVGTALWGYFRHNPGAINPHGRVDDVFPWFISHELPSGLSGLVIAGLFAATMSTISSSMNSIATVVTTDFFKPLKRAATDKESLRFAKWVTVFLGLGGCLIAIYLVYLQNASIWDQYLKIIGLFGGCLAGMFMAGIFFKGINSNGILAGFIISSIALYFIQQSESINFFLYPLFAVIGCVLMGYIFSFFFPAEKKSQTI